MSWDFLLFVFCFFLQAGLLGLVMHGLIVLSDLENDFTNPHDASASLNKWAVPEFVIQTAMMSFLLLCGKWVTGGIHVAMTIYNWREYLRGDHRVDATDVFQKVNFQKHVRIGKLIFYLISFVILIYKAVESAVDAFMLHRDHHVAHNIVKQAAASFDV